MRYLAFAALLLSTPAVALDPCLPGPPDHTGEVIVFIGQTNDTQSLFVMQGSDGSWSLWRSRSEINENTTGPPLCFIIGGDASVLPSP